MKKYTQYINRFLLGISLFSLAACNDFLDEEPLSDIAPEQYLQ